MDKSEIKFLLEHGAATAGVGIVQACLAGGRIEPALGLIKAGLPQRLLGMAPDKTITEPEAKVQHVMLSTDLPSLDVARALLDAWLGQIELSVRKGFFKARRPNSESFGMSALRVLEQNHSMRYIIDVAHAHGVKCEDFDPPGSVAKTILKSKRLQGLAILLEQGFVFKRTHFEYLMHLNRGDGIQERDQPIMLKMLLNHDVDSGLIREEMESTSMYQRKAQELMPIVLAHEAQKAIDGTARQADALKPL